MSPLYVAGGTAISPAGSAGGDLTGTYPNPTVAAGKITSADLANMANATVKGRNTAGTGVPEDVTMAQLSTLLGAQGYQVHINPASGSTAVQGTWITNISAGYFLGIQFFNSSHAVNDAVSWQVSLDAGTYTLTVLAEKSTNLGIATIALGGSTVDTYDEYAGSAAADVRTTTGIVVATAGVKTLLVTMGAKNASSSDYYGAFSWFTFTRTT